MTRSELIQQLASRHPELTQKDIEMAARLILDKIASVLEQKGRVEIRGFGAFAVFHRRPRKGRNPNTGMIIELPAKDVPHFRAGKDLRERVNRSHAVPRSVACPEARLEAMEA
ncbi:integration host factor subunit beta [Sideroxyarcus emersonii]|uniref:Integration host factor subunit beta n=1 Tax=Sideroxyarcus emersonii TaxID=2764705 RepID=A0AAN1XA29_9PROT|nr:integration host factor subunit beta [Sideroxyarcus emersonii]BCK87347.1 integration host factor subunit beta [Sideroxyarcus emersonii]